MSMLVDKLKKKKRFTIESTIGNKIEAIDVLEVNSVHVALRNIIINKVISFRVETKPLRFSPI